MRLTFRRAGRHVAGWAFLVLGAAGLVLPVLQGWLFLALGALLLAPDIPVFGRALDRLERHVPPLRGAIRRARARLERRPPPAGDGA